MNETIQTILTRRSCKKYKSDMLPEETIRQVVEAGLYAASGNNAQSPITLVVTDKETRDRLSRLNAKYDKKHRVNPFYGAPVVLVVLADKRIPTAVYDGSLVLGNMMLAAHALGIGSCWIHRAKEVFADAEGMAILKDRGIDASHYEGIGHLVIGIPEFAPTGILPRKPRRVY